MPGLVTAVTVGAMLVRAVTIFTVVTVEGVLKPMVVAVVTAVARDCLVLGAHLVTIRGIFFLSPEVAEAGTVVLRVLAAEVAPPTPAK